MMCSLLNIDLCTHLLCATWLAIDFLLLATRPNTCLDDVELLVSRNKLVSWIAQETQSAYAGMRKGKEDSRKFRASLLLLARRLLEAKLSQIEKLEPLSRTARQ